ncbi:hypothetical protein Pst134EB_030754 [Puccinia striiformis f. sp. tritici]|nr:hypothetical protein Pst134EB_030754 [Puccinia striiformis f. sp. tritici]
MLSRLPYHSHLNSQLPLAETLWHHQVAIVLAITTFSSVPTFRAPITPTIDLQLDHHHTQQGSTTKG